MRTLAASALILTLALPAAAAQKETETVDRTVSIGTGGTLDLKNFSGDVRIAGTGGGEVVIRAVRRATRERLDRIKLDIQTSGSTVKVQANHQPDGQRDDRDNVVETDFDIQVPYGTKLKLYSFSGKLDVRGVTGQIEAETFSGGIEIDVAAAPELPPLKAETFSGDIEARVPATASGQVRFDSFSGSVRSDLPISMTSTRGGRNTNISGRIGSGSGPTLEFKTFSGDLRIQK
jgi:DUF4097 and DUF4098 domain-containing protein YvlB